MGLSRKYLALTLLTFAPAAAHPADRPNCILQSLDTIAKYELSPPPPNDPFKTAIKRDTEFLESFIQLLRAPKKPYLAPDIERSRQLFAVRDDTIIPFRIQRIMEMARKVPENSETTPLLKRLRVLTTQHQEWMREQSDFTIDGSAPIPVDVIRKHILAEDIADLPASTSTTLKDILTGKINRSFLSIPSWSHPRMEIEKAETYLEIYRIWKSLQKVIDQPSSSESTIQTLHFGEDPAKNRAEIEKYGLVPKYKFELPSVGATFTFSDLFLLHEGRVGIVTKVQTHGKKVLRIFYLSNSNGIFRLLPALNHKIAFAPKFDKAIGEHSLAPPPVVQKFLAEKLAEADLTKLVPEHVWEGVVRENRGMREYLKYLEDENLYIGKSIISTEILEAPNPPPQNDGRRQGVSPKDVKIADTQDKPDFRKATLSYTLKNALLGEVEAKVYESYNGKYEYLVMKDSSNRIWIASIFAKDVPITHFGTPSVVVDGGALTTPLWEYAVMIHPGYDHGPRHSQHHEYALTWKYLREISEIQRWYAETGTPMPE